MKNKYEMVEYSKDLATSISEYSAYELDVLLCIAYVARQSVNNRNVDEGEDLEINLDAKLVKQNMKGNVSNKRIADALLKIFDAKVFFKKDKYTKVRHIFKALEFTEEFKEIKFILDKDYIYLLFNLSKNFTQHRILEFTSLKGKYAKKIYQIIMSYKSQGEITMSTSDFRKLLDCPVKYRWSDIEQKAMAKVEEELTTKTNIASIHLEKLKTGKRIEEVTIKWEIVEPEIIKGKANKDIKMAEKVDDISVERPMLTADTTPLTEGEEEIIKMIEQATGNKRPAVPKGNIGYESAMRYYIKTFGGTKI